MNYGKNATKQRAKKIDAKSMKIRKKFGVIFCKVMIVGVFVMGITGMFAGFGIVKGIIDSAPDISSIDVTPTGYSTTVLSVDGQETATLVASGANRKYVTIDEIPVDLQHAFVAIEDSRFYEHNGIDVKGIARAAASGVKNGFHFNEGASTITQQLIKNNVLTTWTSESSKLESLQRKIQEQYLAVELEKKVNNKEWILENYLNSINLGANTLGVQAASNRYFGKDVSELTLSESAVIAGITKNPVAYNPITHPDQNQKRREKVLKNMKEQNYITEEQYQEALADDVYSRIAEYSAADDGNVNSYFVDALIDEVAQDLQNELGYSETEAYKAIYQGGLTISSTQDLTIQNLCDTEANNPDNYPAGVEYSWMGSFQIKHSDGTYNYYTNQTMLTYYKEAFNRQNINFGSEEECRAAIAEYETAMTKEGDTFIPETESISITLQPQIALTVMDQTSGQVKAIVGGRGDKVGNRTWNRATDTTRQVGSTFKIIASFAPALDAGGLSLASVQDDAPFTAGTKTFKNYDNSFRGYTNIRTAITWSINIVTVKTLQQIGADLGYEYAQKFGFTTLCEDDRNLALALGGLTNGVKNVELCAAYASIANQGTYNEPIFYTQVKDHDGNVILDKTATQESHEVIKKTTAWLLTNAMKDVLTSGTGGRAYFGGSMAQAGKTGTTTSNRDSVFVGFTPYYTCAVWGGYDDNSIQYDGRVSYPSNIWNKVMSQLHAGLAYADFPRPEGIVEVSVCKKSGLLPIEGVCDCDPRGSQVITEYFDKDNVPTETCNHHIALDICNETGLIANAYCPKANVTKKIFIIGTAPETQDAPFLASEDFLTKNCTKHNVSTQLTVPTLPGGNGSGNGDGDGEGDNPADPGNNDTPPSTPGTP